MRNMRKPGTSSESSDQCEDAAQTNQTAPFAVPRSGPAAREIASDAKNGRDNHNLAMMMPTSGRADIGRPPADSHLKAQNPGRAGDDNPGSPRHRWCPRGGSYNLSRE